MSKVPWFRMYSEVLYDPKIQRLSPADFKIWVNLLCLANEGTRRGYLPDEQDIAYALRLPLAKVHSIIERFIEAHLLDTDGVCLLPHNWEGRQFDSDGRETPGRKEWDERRRKVDGKWVTAPRDDGETAAIAPRNGGALGAAEQIQNRTEQIQKQNRTEASPQNGGATDGVVLPVHRQFERSFGRILSPMELEQINALMDEHPTGRIEYALREAAELNKRSVRYVQRICEKQAENGDNHDRPTTRANGAETQRTTAEERATLSRLGFDKPRVFVLDPGGASEGTTGEHSETPSGGLEIRDGLPDEGRGQGKAE